MRAFVDIVLKSRILSDSWLPQPSTQTDVAVGVDVGAGGWLASCSQAELCAVVAAMVAVVATRYTHSGDVDLAVRCGSEGGRRDADPDVFMPMRCVVSEDVPADHFVSDIRRELMRPRGVVTDGEPSVAEPDHLVGGNAAVLPPVSGSAPGSELRFSLDLGVAPFQLAVSCQRSSLSTNRIREIAACVLQAIDEYRIHPSTSIAALNVIPRDMRRALLTEYAGAGVPYPTDRTILQLFTDCAAKAPTRRAVTFGETSLSYEELNGKSNALAAIITDAGVRAHDIIPLIMTNGLELLISMIAVMKAGAAFVPVDRAWPEARIAALLAQLHPSAVLTSSARGLPNEVTVNAAQLPVVVDNVVPSMTMDDVIYGFYTSGSTGEPKCALNLQRGVLNRLLYMTRRFRASGNDIVLQNSPLVFDSSIWQLLWPLTHGAAVVIPEPRPALDITETIDLMERHKVTMTDFVPSIFNVVVEYLHRDRFMVGKLGALRQLLIGGEEISAKAVHVFRTLLPHVGITNTYGPTETSIGMVFHEVSDADRDDIPLGRPIDNTFVVILDERRRLVPIGVVGEIYVGGDCMGAGYLDDPTRTAEAFVDNPFPELAGSTIYRTGDLGHHRPDRTIAFLGRIDQQVKVGGVRIELGEIEGALLRHPNIDNARITVDTIGSGRKVMTGFIVTKQPLESRDIQMHLERILPRYMVPRRFVFLDAMPLTPNGKVDRRALALRSREQRGGPRPKSPHGSSDHAREVLRGIWQNLLRVESVHDHTDFFAAGGDSLLAVEVMLEIEDRLGIQLPARSLYDCPTLSGLVERVEGDDRRIDGAETAQTSRALMRRDAQLPTDMCTTDASYSGGSGGCLLTGSTGFVGSHLLRHLLDETSASVFCLVRADDRERAGARIRSSLAMFGLWDDSYGSRIVPVAGDLRRERLGMSRTEYETLAERVSTVVHCGAMVDLLHDYVHHRATNVAGTLEIIRFGTTARPKTIHHVSTLGVAAVDAGGAAGSCAPIHAPLATGYTQSKWVAEELVAAARSRGVDARSFRLGEVMPSSTTGIPNPKALSHFLITACLALECFPAMEIPLDYSPVDYVARTMIELMQLPSDDRSTYAIFNTHPTSIRTLMRRLVGRGCTATEVPYATFWDALTSACSDGPPNRDLLSLRLLLPSPEADASMTELFATGPVDMIHDGIPGVAMRPFTCDVDDALVGRMAEQLEFARRSIATGINTRA